MEMHAFDQPQVVAGAGTIAAELSEQVPDADTVLVAVGGGGLLGGIAAWYEGRTRVVGVEPDRCPTMSEAIRAGRPIPVDVGGLAADSLGVRQTGEIALALALAYVEHVLLVTDDDDRRGPAPAVVGPANRRGAGGRRSSRAAAVSALPARPGRAGRRPALRREHRGLRHRLMPPPGSDAVAVDGLRVSRGGREVLRGVSFRVPVGSVIGVLGPSGSGKSTLIRALVGVQQRVTGRCDVLGLPAGHPALRARIGYMTQAPAVYFDLTVRENLRYFASVIGADRESVQRTIEDVDLGAEADRVVASLSGGQQSRVSLAAALLGAPELLVLDEPTVGLDPVLRRTLWSLFHRLTERGVTLVVSSHVMEEASQCERLLILREGDLLVDDTEAGLLARTGADDVEDAFLVLVSGRAS